MNLLNTLQNMADYCQAGIVVHKFIETDGRRTVPKFWAQIAHHTISPVMSYHELNCFLMGFSKGKGRP